MQAIQNQQQLELQKYDICKEILQNARNELYLGLRFMDVALSALAFLPDGRTASWGCDGSIFYFQAEYLLEWYRREPIWLNRGFLHQILHCLFGHLWKRPRDREPGQIRPEGNSEANSEGNLEGNSEENSEAVRQAVQRADWDLACDMAVEYLIDGLHLRCTHLPLSALRRDWYGQIEKQMGTVTAEQIYRILAPMDSSSPQYRRLMEEFHRDDHQFWYQPPKNPRQSNPRKDWEHMREKMQTELEVFSKESSQGTKSLTDALAVENRKRYDYRTFLKKFSVLKEAMQVDMDTFDYIFYHYGMELYGNMPLLEPLETKEVRRIEDFVIVIDTSMSCKGELVRAFLEQTWQILSQEETYFRRIHIRILQCDEKVQDDAVIENTDQLRQYMEHLEIKGQGGTDFRPAFLYVQELMRRKVFHKLKGLLYFTDGYGTYPVKKPPYDVAFVFLEQDYRDVDVPPWAMKLILTEDEIRYEY